MNRLIVTTEECVPFPGGWSLWPEQMRAALNAVTYGKKIRVLEFGSGSSTLILAEILGQRAPLHFVSYENNPKYACQHASVKTILYQELPPDTLAPGKYDLVIIDGPTVIKKKDERWRWYIPLKQHVRRGTILVIDDIDHYPHYQELLDEHFKYTIVDECHGDHRCWKTVRIEGVK